MDKKEKVKYHLIGIGGAGMSALAIVLKGMGFKVTGSDLKESRYINLLKNQGIEVYIGHSRKNLKDTEVVIYSTAIPEDNEELEEARAKGLTIKSRAGLLAGLLNSKKGIAITGTHGKTTTTSMISLILRGMELDPTIIIGGELNELGSNAKYGKGDYLVAEACESDGSFLEYKPYISVVTNIEDDHLDYYKDFDNLKKGFLSFLNNTRDDGCMILNGDEIGILDQSKIKKCQKIYFGLSSDNDIYAKDIELKNFSTEYNLFIDHKGTEECFKVKLNVPGVHNIKNSLAALSICSFLGMDIQKCIDILRFYTGTKRRFEKKGEKDGIMVFDDYAHHPTEVDATLKTASIDKTNRIIAIFQPHRYTRLSSLFEKFGRCFEEADILIITDVYSAGEKPIPGVTGKLLLDTVLEENRSSRVVYIPKIIDIPDYLQGRLKKGDIVITMGAGDISSVSDQILKKVEP